MKKYPLQDDKGIEKKIIEEKREELRDSWSLSPAFHRMCSCINVMRALSRLFFYISINESVEFTRDISQRKAIAQYMDIMESNAREFFDNFSFFVPSNVPNVCIISVKMFHVCWNRYENTSTRL